MELNLMQDIVVYNQIVTKQIDKLTTTVNHEITSVALELEKEEIRRVTNDKILLAQCSDFLENLQLPNIRTKEEIIEFLEEQKRQILKLES